MYYFRASIPHMPDGSIATYSPGWFGEMDRCPQNVTVDAYNDADAYLLARSDDAFVPPEVTVLSDADYQAALASLVSQTTDGSNGIWTGDVLLHRWDAPPEVVDGPGAMAVVSRPWMKPKTKTLKAIGTCWKCALAGKEATVYLTSNASFPGKINGQIKLTGKCPNCGETVTGKVIHG